MVTLELKNAFEFINWSQVNWKQLSPFDAHDFKWVYGQTPFSHVQVPVWMTVFYLTSIVVLQKHMKDRKPYSLKLFNQMHNLFLTILSTAMFLGVIYGIYLKTKTQSIFHAMLCQQEEDPMYGFAYYWSYIFYLSKYYEYIDTWLLILKKKPVIFLHSWHHMVMPYVGWAGLQGKWAMALWTSCMLNSFVHIFMYSYYFLSTLGWEIWWKKYLTMMQILQFVTGIALTIGYYAFYFSSLTLPNGLFGTWDYVQGCTGDLWAVQSMFFVNNSFLVLFIKFYIDTYKKPRSSGSKKKPESSAPEGDKKTN